MDDLDRFMTERGFVTVAAGTFVGEHSYSTPETPIAQGRPDARDLAAATAFGAQVREKLAKTRPSPGRNPETASDTAATTRATQTGSMDAAKAPATGALVPIDPTKLREPRTPLLPKLRFIRFVLGYRRRQKRHPVVLLPEGDAARCTQCGRCTRRRAAHRPGTLHPLLRLRERVRLRCPHIPHAFCSSPRPELHAAETARNLIITLIAT